MLLKSGCNMCTLESHYAKFNDGYGSQYNKSIENFNHFLKKIIQLPSQVVF